MPKMQVYLPEPLYERVKQRGGRLNVSGVLQRALEEALTELEREEALAVLVDEYAAEHGHVTTNELAAQEAADQAAARRTGSRRRRSPAA